MAILGPKIAVGRHCLKKLLNDFGLINDLYPDEYKKLWEKIAAVPISWEKANHGYLSEISSSTWKLRINNSEKGEPKYTLLIDEQVLLSFDALPANWLIAG